MDGAKTNDIRSTISNIGLTRPFKSYFKSMILYCGVLA